MMASSTGSDGRDRLITEESPVSREIVRGERPAWFAVKEREREEEEVQVRDKERSAGGVIGYNFFGQDDDLGAVDAVSFPHSNNQANKAASRQVRSEYCPCRGLPDPSAQINKRRKKGNPENT